MTGAWSFVTGFVVGLVAAGAAGYAAWRQERENADAVRALSCAYLGSPPLDKDGTLS